MLETRTAPAPGRGNHWQMLTRSSATHGLPDRVAQLVRMKDRESEKLLCLVQLILAATLALLYAIAPRPADAGMSLAAPVPIALAVYVALTLARISYVRRASLPAWAVAASIVADISLLLSLIWAFHWAYAQPPAFSLKAPTFVYLFVFIAIRALRFDFRAVLTAGLAAAAGWLILTVGAISASGANTITRNFTDYILSNHILIGAEFDKIFAILVVTLVLAIASWRAERTLVEAVRVQAANREIGRFLSRGVADHIANAEQEVTAGMAVERDAAIMFLDIRGFTRFSMTVPPAKVVDRLTSFHARIVPAVRANNGVIDKFLGDGVMITFGAVVPSDHAVADALRALEVLLMETQRWQDDLRAAGTAVPLTVNAALASGRIVFAALGDVNRLEYTVIGEAANLAAKLEKHNKVEQSLALTPLETYRLGISQGFKPASEPQIRLARSVSGVNGMIDLAAWPAEASDAQ